MRLTLWKLGLGACVTFGCAVEVAEDGAAGQLLVDGGPTADEAPYVGGSGGSPFVPSTGGAPPAAGAGPGTGGMGGYPATGGSAPTQTGGAGAVLGTGGQVATGGAAMGGSGTGGGFATGGAADAGALPPPLFPEPVDVTTLPPSPDNPPECPDVAPENPVGDCLGLPVYLNCQWGDARRTYSCVCDWYHWLCI